MNNEMRMIENDLVPVYETSTGERVVYGSELHKVLEVKSKFADWVKNRLNDCEALEDEDFQSFSKILEKGGRPKLEYLIKLDTAKEMAMLERNDKGKQVRRYFIKIEKKYKQEQKPRSAVQIIQAAILEVDQKINNVDNDLQTFKKDMPLLGVECDEISKAKNRIVVPLLGGKEAPAYMDNSLRSKVYRDINNQLCREFNVSTYKAIKRGKTELAIQIIKNYRLPLALEEQVRYMNAQQRLGL